MQVIKIGSDFSGVGAFDYAMKRVASAKGFGIENVFACDMDKFARQSYLANHDAPGYYPENVYHRTIPIESLDVYMTSPPCQAFSLAGKRLGKDDHRGILFFNSLEFIRVNKPRFFIFENVKGLLSDDGGKTFSEWVNFLGGKSVNNAPVLFPYDDAVPYHIYFEVLNAKEHGIPQNRERIFIVGIRDDVDNDFRFPKTEFLTKKLMDVLENDVNEKYYLSEKMHQFILNSKYGNEKSLIQYGDICNALKARDYKDGKCIYVNSNNSKGYEIATTGDSINFDQPNSKTRRGRVGNQVSQTLTTSCNQGVFIAEQRLDEGLRMFKDNVCGTIRCIDSGGDKRVTDGKTIRKLTPRECFRLMDFPDDFKFVVSNAQLYKQAGNSIVVRVLEKIISNLKLINK